MKEKAAAFPSGLPGEPSIPKDWPAALKEQEKPGVSLMDAWEAARKAYPGLFKEAMVAAQLKKSGKRL